jgi:hypothetical protein
MTDVEMSSYTNGMELTVDGSMTSAFAGTL